MGFRGPARDRPKLSSIISPHRFRPRWPPPPLASTPCHSSTVPRRACRCAIHDLAAEVDHELTACAELVLLWEPGAARTEEEHILAGPASSIDTKASRRRHRLRRQHRNPDPAPGGEQYGFIWFVGSFLSLLFNCIPCFFSFYLVSVKFTITEREISGAAAFRI